jgi:sigma-E factor negative regulatory protein RseC
MYDRGTVTAIDKNIVTITCGNPEQCNACAASKLFCKIKTKEFQALNTNNIDLKTGDDVEIYLSPAKSIIASFSVLMFPLIMFIIGYYLTAKLTNTISDGVKVLGGIVGLGAGFISAFLYQYITRKQKSPVITKKFDAEI